MVNDLKYYDRASRAAQGRTTIFFCVKVNGIAHAPRNLASYERGCRSTMVTRHVRIVV